MRMNKYAVRFSGFQETRAEAPHIIFSESGIAAAAQIFRSVFDALDSLAGFVVQRNRTEELGKQLNAQKKALNADINSKTEQLRCQYEEELKRMRLKIVQEKKEMDFELQRLSMETAEKAKDFAFSYEEYMKSNKLFLQIIYKEKKFLEETQSFIDDLSDDYSKRKEYIVYCDLQRKSLELIDAYLKQMI